MKKYYIPLCIFLSAFSNTVYDPSCPAPYETCIHDPKTVFIPIPQGLLLFLQYHKEIKKDDHNKTHIDFFYDYQISNNSKDIAGSLYGNNVIKAGSNTDRYAWNPEYFGLGGDATIHAAIKPVINNQIFNLECSYADHNGFWAQIDIPITYSIWQLKTGIHEGELSQKNLQDAGTIFIKTDQDGNISGGNDINALIPINSAERANNLFSAIPGTTPTLKDDRATPQYVNTGEAAPLIVSLIGNNNTPTSASVPFALGPNMTLSLTQQTISPAKNMESAMSGYTYGNLKSYEYNKIPLLFSRPTNTSWKVANILLMAGWDTFKKDCMTGGIYAKCILPSGTKINKEWNAYSFNPVVGNGNRFQLGGGVYGFYHICETDSSVLTLHGDCYATHIFGLSQWRSFDKKESPLSRYIIVKEYNYQNNYTNNDFALGDKNANHVTVSNSVQAEAVINILYRFKHLTFDAGYAWSYLSKEKASKNCKTEENNDMQYGYKGNTTSQQISISQTPSSTTNWNINNTKITIESNNDLSIDNTISFIPSQTNQVNKAYLFPLGACINESGLMNAQILEKIFLKSAYHFNGKLDINLGGFIAYSFSPKKYCTASFCEMGISIGGSF
jgi:hypothetical protein